MILLFQSIQADRRISTLAQMHGRPRDGSCVNVMWRLMEKRCLAETLILLRSAWIFQKKSRWWFQKFVCFHPYLGKIPILTNIFQMG